MLFSQFLQYCSTGRLLFQLLWNPYLFVKKAKSCWVQFFLGSILWVPHVYECRVELRYRKNSLRVHYAYWAYAGHSGTGTSYILPSGSNSVQILRRFPLPRVQVPQSAANCSIPSFFFGVKYAFWFLLTFHCQWDRGIQPRDTATVAAIPGYAIYFLPELFGIPSPGSLGVSLRMAIHELDIDRNFGLHNWKCGSWTRESKKEKKTPESKGVTSTPPS